MVRDVITEIIINIERVLSVVWIRGTISINEISVMGNQSRKKARKSNLFNKMRPSI